MRDFIGGEQPPVDLKVELALQQLLVEGARRGLLRSAQDCSTGGLAGALAEAAMGGPYAVSSFGATVTLPTAAASATDAGDVVALYGEDHGRAIVSCDAAKLDALIALAEQRGVPASKVGSVGAVDAAVTIQVGQRSYAWPVAELRTTYFEAIPRRMR